MARCKWTAPRFFDQHPLPRKISHPPQRRQPHFEALEPRILLSADLLPAAADALSDGMDQFGDRLEDFLILEGQSDGLLNTQLPFIVQVQESGDGLEQVAPTLGTLFSVQVDTNGAAGDGIDPTLDGLDANDDKTVDAGEFIQGWLFGQIEEQLEGYSGTTAEFATWLAGLNKTLTVAQVGSPSVAITLDVISATDLTEAVPNADLMFDVDFTLTVSQNLAIDLGTEADALKLLYYTGPYDSKASPVIPVDAALEFGFTFGVHTGGQDSPGETLDGGDFFVRTADDLNISANSNDPDDDTTDIEGAAFHLNIGFLGAEVAGGTIDFQAAVSTLLIDPDSPEVLGFTTDQYGVEQASGVVTSFDAIPSKDLEHDAGFVLRIGNAGITTEVKVLVDENADLNGLLVDVNTALETAGLDELIEASLDGSNHLVFTLIETTDTPLGFANESFSNSGVLSADPGAVDFASDRTFLLSVDGALPELVTVVFPDTARTELGFADSQAASLPPLVAEAAPTTDELSGDATFSIAVRKVDGSLVTGTVVVTAADTAGNTDYYYLADDINLQITTDAPALAGLIAAAYDGTHFRFVPDGSIRAVDIYAEGTAQSEIGFGSHQITTLALTASNTPIATFDLSSDAHFELNVSYDTGSGMTTRTVVVTIPADLNDDAAALAADINAAIDTALAIDKVDVLVDSTGKFVLEAKDASVYALSISTNNTLIGSLVADVQSALNKAGLGLLVTASAVDADTLQLATTGGQTLEITKTLTFDAGVTYTELLEPPALGGTATEDLFTPEIDEDHSNIQFNLPVSINPGLNYNPANVAIVGNFSPFARLLVDPLADPPEPVVAEIGLNNTRFDLNFTYTPSIEHQDTPLLMVPNSSILTEQIRLVNMAEPLNFNLITADNMIGLIMGLGTALQQIANSGLFAGYDIPFADATLADLLNYSDSDGNIFAGLFDTLLIYETGGNGIDEVGVIDPVPNDQDRLLTRVHVDKNNDGIETTDEQIYLATTFVTAQELAEDLNALLLNMGPTGIHGINANYEPFFTLRGDAGAIESGILSAAATFDLVVDTGSGPVTHSITIDPDGTNLILDDLAADIDTVLAAYSISATAVDGRIVLKADSGVYFKSFSIANLNEVTKNELGFLADQEAMANLLTYDLELIGSGRTLIGTEGDDPDTPVFDPSFTAPFEYDVDLSYFNKMLVNTGADEDVQTVALQGFTGANLTFGIDLSPPGAIIYGDTYVYQLNGGDGIDIKYESALTGESTVRSVYGLIKDSEFSIKFGEQPAAIFPVIIRAADTADNLSFNDLVDDINDALATALAGTSFEGEIIAGTDPYNPTHLAIGRPDLGDTFQIYVSSTDSWVTELGFPNTLQNGAPIVVNALFATKDAPFRIGRLSSDAIFGIDFGGDGADLLINVESDDTAGNRTIIDLVTDVNKAIYNAYIAAGVTAEDLAAHPELIKIRADYDNSANRTDYGAYDTSTDLKPRLILTATDATTEFSVIVDGMALLPLYLSLAEEPVEPTFALGILNSGVLVATSQLGLPSGTTNASRTDFIIHTEVDGVSHDYEITLDEIILDPSDADKSSVQELIELINAQLPVGVIEAGFNETQTGLRLYYAAAGPVPDVFRVETLNGSDVIATMGLFGADNTGTAYEVTEGDPRLIEGGKIGETQLDDRFFVRDAEMWGAVGMQTPTASMAHPAGIPGTALFGIVGVDTNLQGSLYAGFSAAIKDPATGIAGGMATLLELFEGAVQGRLTEDATFSVAYGSTPGDKVWVTVPQDATLANKTLEELVADVNTALALTSFGGIIEARVSGTRIEFVALDDPNTEANEARDTQFIITAGNASARSGLGLDPLQTSLPVGEVGKEVMTVTANAASRYAVAEVVVDEASTLSIGVSFPFSPPFTPGTMVYGWMDSADEDTIPDMLSGDRAYVIGVDSGGLILVNVEGTFANAQWLTNNPESLYAWTVGASGNGSTVVPRDSFGQFDLMVDVQDEFATKIEPAGEVPTGFGSGFDTLLDDQYYPADFKLTGFGNPYDPDQPVAAFSDLAGDLGDLYAFRDLDYADIGSALHGLLDLLNDINEDFDLLTLELPAINKSISELLSLVDGFQRGMDNLDEIFAAAIAALDPDQVDIPALTLQDIPNVLRGAFGFPEGVDPDGTDAVDWVKLDFDQANNMLLVDLNLHETLDTKLGLDIEIPNLPNLTSAGVLKVNGTLDINFNFGIDLAAPNNAYLFDTSNIAAELHVTGEGQTYETIDETDEDPDGMGLVFRASLGPLAVFIQDGEANIDVAFALPGLNFGGTNKKLIGEVDFDPDDTDNPDDFLDPVVPENWADIVLPMFYGGEGPDNYLGDFSAEGYLVNPATLEQGTLDVIAPDFSDIEADIISGDIEYDPFENIMLGIDTLNVYLEVLSDSLAGDVLGINLPFIGDQMADILFIENFRNTLYSILKNGVANAIDPTPDLVTDKLYEALGLYEDFSVDYQFDLNSTDIKDWFHQWNFTLTDSETIFLSDFDLGIPGFEFDIDTPVQVEFAWTLDIGFGVNFVEGAYIDVSDISENELDLDLRITLPNETHDGMLNFLTVQVTEEAADPEDLRPQTGVLLDFVVDVQKQDAPSAGHLGFSDIGKVAPVATLSGTALDGGNEIVSLHLNGELGGFAVLPRVSTDLEIDWSLQDVLVSSLANDPILAGLEEIAYTGMSMDGGSIVTDFLAPIFDEIHSIIQPFMPVVDVLTAPIPVLSDLLGEPFTLLDLAEIFGSVDADFIEAVADILTLIDKFTEPGTLPVDMPLGDVILYSKTGPDAGFDPFAADPDLSAIDPSTLGSDVIFDPNHTDPVLTAFDLAVANSELLNGLKTQEFAKGLSVPLLTDGFQSIGLLFGRNAVMVDYALPPLGVDFEYLQVFPIWGPLAISIELSFGFTVDLHSVGFDTFGLDRYADGGFRNPAVIFDGFYLNDLNAEGVDDPEVTFEFGLVAAAELNLGIARAGVGGGINALITFNWYDPIADGRVHISELIGNVITADNNPLAVFDVGGALTFQLFAFIEISILGIEEEFPITPETELFSFEETFSHDPIMATDIGGGVLQLNIGPNSEDRIYGNISDNSETVAVSYAGGQVTVGGMSFSGISHIVGIGGQGNDIITLELGDSGITYELEGGLGDDSISVTGGGGGTIDGGVGNDTIQGGGGNDSIIGGEGNDFIRGGDGQDIIFGDQGRSVQASTYVTTPYITSRVTLVDGIDEIHGEGGDDIILGAGGDDKLFGDAGDDILIGDGGRFEYTPVGTDKHIDVSTLRPAAYIPSEVYTDDPDTPAEISTAIDGIYDALMMTFHATDLFYGGNDEIHGGENDDMMFGGSGNDILEGDSGNDLILGGKGFDEIFGGTKGSPITLSETVTDMDTIFGGDQADIISGNEDADVISGGSGNDYIHGNDGNDVMKGDSGADVMFGDKGDDQLFGLTEPDILFGGADNDLVVGGTSNDIMFGDDGLVAKLDPADTAIGLKVIYNDLLIDATTVNSLLAGVKAMEGEFSDADERTLDLIFTYITVDDGDDIMSGEAADDIMLGGGGNDLMGGDVDPRLPGMPEQDGEQLPTPISEDLLIGDGGIITFDQRRFRSIATVIEPDDATIDPDDDDMFNDVIYGDNGNDYLFGGWGHDFLFGGHGKVVDITLGVAGVGAFRDPTDADASDNDIMLGDNGEILFAGYSALHPENFGIKELIRTTDESDTTGGHDYAEGELGNDVIFGGVNGSVDVLIGNYGDDVILGDNGELDFDYDDADHDLDTLDLIRSYRDGLGGTDIISGKEGSDVLIGGTGGDEMYGDDADASSGAADGEDIMLGDNADIFLIGTGGRLTVQVAEMTTGTAVDLITTTDRIDVTDPEHDTSAEVEDDGGPDTMSGNAGNDIMLGGVNNDDGNLLNGIEKDVMYGDRAVPNSTTIENDGDDIMLGDNGSLDFTFDDDPVTPENDTDRMTLDLIRSREDGLGGVDVISGNKGLDVAIGGTAGDTIYGDDAAASAADDDLADLLLGDNADIFLVAAPVAPGAGVDLKTVLDAAVKTIRTTDKDHPEYGGSDTLSGNAKGDIIAGGVFGDTLYGDRSVPTATTEADDGDDIILGDNGAFEWLSTGRLGEIIGIDIPANNPALWEKYGTSAADTDLTTLDLVTTEQPTSGGRDLIYGDEDRDFVFGGTDTDEIYGDDGNLDEEAESANNDLLFGDHGRIYPQFSTLRADGQDWRLAFNSRNFFAIDVGDSSLLISNGGEGDRMWGEEGDDTMLGQQGDDRMWGGAGDDDMTGGHNVAGGYDELTAPAVAATLNPPVNDLMDGGSGDDSMAGDNTIIWRRGDDDSPRFRELTGDTIYSTTNSTIAANVGADWQSDPADAIGRDIQLVDHSDAVQADPLGRFGNDVMAGGADSDTMFGELGNDLMQGDGAIESTPVADPFISRTLTVTDSGSPDTGETLYFNIPELASDADDYLEGNGGSDLMYGGLGQDDMLGGSSALFGLTTEVMRPDTTDYIYGGAGIDTERNTIGATTFGLAVLDNTDSDGDPADMVITTTADGHARDADYIMGDNANVYRLVNVATDEFRNFNYDDAYGMQILPRAMQQLDYTLGGADYAGGFYANGAANADNGAADLIHGESGDDIIFGMTGSDVIFGEGQDDDIVGGYGHDWISGGTGQDGVLGDDGLILTSRNSLAGEPLYGIAGLLDKDPRPKYADGNVLDEVIKTPGEIQYAVINLTGELKKTIDLVPFSYDPDWVAMDDEFPDNQDDSPYADDIVFGGLGTDWLHGGSGDDAISGAEALETAYVPVYDAAGVPTGVLDLGYYAVDLDAATIEPGITQVMAIPGDVLAFNPEDTDGQHLNNRYRAGEFDLYDEYDPRRTILLTPSGELYKDTGGTEGVDYFQFLLNFDESEGVVRDAGTVPKATGQETEEYPAVNDDGKDAIFGDLGNDWLVGGTGRDNLYGGWGNDLLNADDDHDGHDDVSELNDFTDTHPYYEDRAYGGAGRDVLIANTGGDRLIDWVGEYNSYLVPYAPFGQASVSRTLQPFLPEFLYALSAGDGADPTRPTDTGADPLRNGEPDAEMGLVLQKDFAWQDQTGAPADPQAGNIPGGARDVLRSATFNDDTTQGFVADSGTWLLKSGVFYVEPTVLGTDAVSVWYHDQVLPSYFELTATVVPVKPLAGYKANAYIVFDYYGPDDFKFAGLNSSTNKIEIGQHTVDGWQVLTSSNMLVKAGTSYNLLVALNGTTATIVVNNKLSLSYGFAPHLDIYGLAHNINEGMIGLGTDNAKASIDNVNLMVLPPTIAFEYSDEFAAIPALLAGETGSWALSGSGYYLGIPAAGASLALASGDFTVDPNYLLQLETKIATTATGGIIFDQYDTDDFKWAAYSRATNQVLLGHFTARDGWVVDKSVDVKKIDGDVTLSLTLKGTTVSVLFNGAAALSHVFNAVVTDGGFGLLAKDGMASFDTFTVKTDDPNFALPTSAAALMAAAAAPETAEPGDEVTEAALTELADAARSYWQNVLGAGAVASLDGITVENADLAGLLLGQTSGSTIQIDLDAAGYGWFVDETANDSSEFLRRGGRGQGMGHDTFLATKGSDAFGHMDLLTVLTHEMGHLLGFDHDSSWSVMDDELDAGTRILPKKAAAVAAPGKFILMAAKEALVFDEGQGAFHELLQEALRNWTDGRAGRKGPLNPLERQQEEDPFWLVEV